VILLNNINLTDNPTRLLEKIKYIAGDVPVILLSAPSKTGFDALSPYLRLGKTVTLVGSSGVGEFMLINALYDETVQKTADIREDDEKGRHTTTVRQLFVLPSGAILIDNPGIREIQLGDSAEGLEKEFSDIARAHNCRFKDGTHREEPGCTVFQAVKDGLISEEQLDR
jgi:ribosome biogenesis GTPase / thiamine phosphate phosphatase